MSVTKQDFPIEVKELTIEQRISLLYTKLRLYYRLKAFLEDIDILRDGHKRCLANLYTNKQQLQKKSRREKEKRYAELLKSYATCLERVNRMLSLCPHMITFGNKSPDYLLEE
jgi:hypothetical protein